MEKFRRCWLDFKQDVVFGSGLGESLRHLSQRWSAMVGGSVGLRTIVSPHQSARAPSRAGAPGAD